MSDWFETGNIKDAPRELLETFYHNQKYRIKVLERKLKDLTGCSGFGTCDGTVGSCVECFYNEKELFKRCENFTFNKLNKL